MFHGRQGGDYVPKVRGYTEKAEIEHGGQIKQIVMQMNIGDRNETELDL